MISEAVTACVPPARGVTVSAVGLPDGLRTLNVEAGWYAIVAHSHGDDFAEQLLRERDVLVQPGYFYDFEDSGYLVLSLLTRPDVFHEGVKNLRLLLDV